MEPPSLAVPDGGGPGRTPDAAPPSPVEDDRAPAAPGVRQCKLACLQWELSAAGARLRVHVCGGRLANCGRGHFGHKPRAVRGRRCHTQTTKMGP